MNGIGSRIALGIHERLTGRHILARLIELEHSQWLSKAELLAIQQDKLQNLLNYAYQYVPYYRKTFDAVGFHPDRLYADPGSFTRIPILTKAIIRQNFSQLLTTDQDRQKYLSRLSTSGSTGEPLVFMQDSNFRDSVTADIQRHIGWAGWKLGEPQAFIWGARRNPSRKQRLRLRVIDFIWNRFQIDAFSLTNDSLSGFASQIQRRKARYLYGYVAGVHAFARYVRSNLSNKINFEGIFTSAETLLPLVRAYIEETFDCKVFNRYGTLELGGVGCECKIHAGLHVSMENNYVEILKDGLPAQSGEIGDLIVTNLNNWGMPFIRYSIGDLAKWEAASLSGDNARCACGRASLKIGSLEGRMTDTFRSVDGRMTWSGFAGAPFACLAHPSIKQFQVVQKSLDRVLVRLAQDGEIPSATMSEISQVIRDYFGSSIKVEFECLDEIVPLPSGKHLYAYSEVDPV